MYSDRDVESSPPQKLPPQAPPRDAEWLRAKGGVVEEKAQAGSELRHLRPCRPPEIMHGANPAAVPPLR